jgi:hypothetical protein
MLSRPAISGGSREFLASCVCALLSLPVAAGVGCASSDTIDLGTGGAGGRGGIPFTSASTDESSSGDTASGNTSTSDTSTSSDTSSGGTGGGDASPTGVSLMGSTSTLQVGNMSGGIAANALCPMGQVLIGFSGALSAANGYIGKIRGQCGTLSISTSAPFTISVTTGASLSTYGTFAAAPWSSFCPVNQVVVGFEGRSGLLVDRLSLHCAPLIISGPPFTVATGFVSVLMSVGGAGGSPFSPVDCPDGQIATEARLRVGNGIDAFGLSCSTIALTF